MGYHIVTEVIESEFVVGSVCNIAVISLTSLVIVEAVENTADCESEPAKNLSHFLCLSLSEVVVNGNNVNALAGKCVKVRCNAGNESFTFTCSHFGDSSLMKNDSADELNGIGLLFKDTPCSLADCCESLRKDSVKGFALFESVLEFKGLSLELCI